MSRFFAPISVDDLKAKVNAVCGGRLDYRKLVEKLGTDLKVEFDLENCDYGDDFGPRLLTGYRTLANGLTFLGCCAGGDWEHPVFFLVYWDGKKLRGYVPTEGNPWNTTTKQAYGNDEDADLKNAKKRWPDIYKDVEEVESHDFSFDPDAIEKDILARIQPQAKAGKPAKAPAAKKPTTLRERIEALKYYGTGDEAYELFQQTCGLCYKMYGLGQAGQAKILCMWAEDQAAESAKFWEQEGLDLADTDDTAKGYWGNVF